MKYRKQIANGAEIIYWNENFQARCGVLTTSSMCTSAASRWGLFGPRLTKCFSLSQVHQILLEYCQTCYPNVPVSTTFPVFFVMSMLMTHVMLMHMTSIRVQSMTIFATIMRGSLLQVAVIWFLFSFSWDFMMDIKHIIICSLFEVLKIDDFSWFLDPE